MTSTAASPDRAGGSTTETVTVRYFAGARAAAGQPQEQAPAGLDLDGLATLLTERHGERLGVVLKVASFLVDGVVCRDRRSVLRPGVTVDVLPPFAGG